jgi:hypothetical protein
MKQAMSTGESWRAIALSIGVAAAALAASAGSSLAQSTCQEDFAKLQGAREAQVKSLNALSRGGKAKIDPGQACPRLRSLAASERTLLDYMVKNKDWCSVPDQAIDTLRKTAARTGQIAAQACNVAVQMKKARAAAEAQARNGGGSQVQRMPAGPL